MAYVSRNPNGQTTMANSEPVVIANNQSAFPVNAQDGAGNALTSHTAGAAKGLDVAIIDGSGNQITTFGGGTEYTESATDASITGTAMLMEGAADTLLPVQGTIADGLLVNLGTNNDVTITGTVAITDNAGSLTVDNAGTFVVQVDGAALTSLQLLDDVVAIDGAAILTKGFQIAGTDGTNAQIIKTDVDGELQVDVLTMPTVTVSATDLDVRNLVFATDKIDVSGSTLAANSGVDIGDVTINNASGAAAVNIQDGGNSITVDGTVTIQDGGNTITVDNGGTFAVQATLTPATSGGLTTYHLVSAASTNATVVKASAGQLFGWYIYNSNAAMRKLAFHNSASSPTAGASVFFTINLPPSAAANVFLDTGIAFSAGIAITTVTGLADNDSAAVALNDLTINLFYK